MCLPYLCCLCEERSDTDYDLCRDCSKALPWVEDRCYRCAKHLSGLGDSIHCTQCLEVPPKFDRVCAIFNYEPPITQMITRLKFGQQRYFGRILGEILVQKLQHEWYRNEPLPEAIIPIPLHAKRLRKRGYNQVFELLRPVKKCLNIPIIHNACTRSRATRPQTGLRSELRRDNMHQAFALKKRIRFKHIAIMDDVVTTGSTVQALCEILKNTRVERIDVWCICRV